MAKIVHKLAGRVIDEYPLREGVLSIGRGKENDIRLEDLTVSGRHALLEIKPNAYMDNVHDVYVVDQQSTNGTVINGRHIKRHLLKHGEVAVIGEHEFGLIDEDALGLERTMIYIPDDK